MGSATRAFDRIAASYDVSFTDTRLGRALRNLVWERLARAFAPGDRVLELNCGTGEDALFLAARGVDLTATDGSDAMLDVARRKLGGTSVRLRKLDLERPPARIGDAPFDGAFSNFGGLNCLPDASALAPHLHRWLRPEARVILVVMGPFCLWESVGSLARGDVRAACRRLGGGTASFGELTFRVHYPSPRRLARALGPYFETTRTEALGVALPPSTWSEWMETKPRTVAALSRLERRLRTVRGLSTLADHYVLELRRRP